MFNTYNLIILFVAIADLIFYFSIVILYRFNKFTRFVSAMKVVYKGFDPSTATGIIKGSVWALVDGIITGVVVAFIVRLSQ
jgi:hypothetical protein